VSIDDPPSAELLGTRLQAAHRGARWRVGRTLRRAPLTVPELKPAVEPPAQGPRRRHSASATLSRLHSRPEYTTIEAGQASTDVPVPGLRETATGPCGPEYPSVASSARSSAIACPGAQTAADGRYSDGRLSTFGSSTSSTPDRGKVSLLTNCRNVIRVVLTTHVHNNKRWRRAFGRSDFNSRHATACRLVASHMH
jgi:hypothetical protein